MADFSVSQGHFGVMPFTLVANTAQAVAFTDNVNEIQVITDGTSDVLVKVGSGDPSSVPSAGASLGASTYVVPTFAPFLAIKLDGSVDRVSCYSSGTPKVVVQKT